MRIGRTIFALLIALSVAALPAVGMTGANAGPAGMVAADMVADMDCCPPSKAPCGMPVDQCPAYSCAQSITISGISAPQVVYPPAPADRMPARAGGAFHPHTNGTPFRPPRA